MKRRRMPWRRFQAGTRSSATTPVDTPCSRGRSCRLWLPSCPHPGQTPCVPAWQSHVIRLSSHPAKNRPNHPPPYRHTTIFSAASLRSAPTRKYTPFFRRLTAKAVVAAPKWKVRKRSAFQGWKVIPDLWTWGKGGQWNRTNDLTHGKFKALRICRTH
jgi:hypothetical protein